MKCNKHHIAIKYLDIRVGQEYKNRGLCQKCVPSTQRIPGIVTLKEGQNLMQQVIQQRSNELILSQSISNEILNEIKNLFETCKLQIFGISSELYRKSVFIYGNYKEHQQLADQLSKDIIFNLNQFEIKPYLYEDPVLIKHNEMLTEILNIMKPKPEKMDIEIAVEQYQKQHPQVYGRQVIQLQGHTEQVNEVAFSYNGVMVASGSHDSTVNLWSLKTMKKLKTFKGHEGAVYCVTFSKCDTLLASGESGFNDKEGIKAILIWDIQDLKLNKPLYTLKGHTESVLHIKFAKVYLVSFGEDQTIRVWNKEKQIACYQNKNVEYGGVAISHDDQLIAANCGLNIRIYHAKKSKKVMEWRNPNSNWEGGICFSNNSKLVFSSDWNKGHIRAWNCYSVQSKLIRKAKFGHAYTCSVSSDSTTLATADSTQDYDDECYVHLIDIGTWKLTQNLAVIGGYSEEGQQSLNFANFSGDNQYVGTGSKDGSIRLFKRKQDGEDDDVKDDSSSKSDSD